MSHATTPIAPLSAAATAQNAAKFKALADLFPKHQLTLNVVELLTYEVDAGFDRGRPEGVFFPESAQDVSKLMQWAVSTNTPLVARGAGTGSLAARCRNMAASCFPLRV